MLAECRRLASFRMPLIIGAVAVVSCGTDGLGAMPGDWHRKRVERYTIGEKVLPRSQTEQILSRRLPRVRYLSMKNCSSFRHTDLTLVQSFVTFTSI